MTSFVDGSPPSAPNRAGAPAPPVSWPYWWSWELQLTSHVLRRGEQRGFTEVDVRRMLEEARRVRPDSIPGRWVVDTSHAGGDWEVIIELDAVSRVVVVVTANRTR